MQGRRSRVARLWNGSYQPALCTWSKGLAHTRPFMFANAAAMQQALAAMATGGSWKHSSICGRGCSSGMGGQACEKVASFSKAPFTPSSLRPIAGRVHVRGPALPAQACLQCC